MALKITAEKSLGVTGHGLKKKQYSCSRVENYLDYEKNPLKVTQTQFIDHRNRSILKLDSSKRVISDAELLKPVLGIENIFLGVIYIQNFQLNTVRLLHFW
jgi:hypothetical protein